jgi:uncharacterized membrane protein
VNRRAALLSLLLLAFAWRIHALTTQSLWRDEVDAIWFATRDLPMTLSMFVDAGQNGPLYFLALRPWFNLVGTSEFALRFPSVLAGTLSVALLWQVGRRLAPLRRSSGAAATPDAQNVAAQNGAAQDTVALLAALFLAFNPYQLWYSQEGKMYTVTTALVLLATWCWLAGIGRGGWRPWLAYWLTVTLGMYTHLLLVLLIPLHLLWYILAWPAARRHWRGYALTLAGLTLPYLPMVWWQWDLLMAAEQRTGFRFTPLPSMARTLLLNHSRGFMPPGALIWLAPVFFLGAAGLILGVGELARSDAAGKLTLAPWRRYALLLTWLVAPVLSIYALSLRQPIFTDRYVIWIAPAAMLALGLGVVVVLRYGWRLGPALAGMLVVYVVGFWLVAGWQQKTLPMKYDLRSGVQYIAARRTPDALLILQIPHMEFAYRYYSSDFGPRPFAESEARLQPWMPGLWTNYGADDAAARATVDRQMQPATPFTEIWVLRSEVEMWDNRYLMDAWLDAHGTAVEEAQFHGVQVRRYRMGEE